MTLKKSVSRSSSVMLRGEAPSGWLESYMLPLTTRRHYVHVRFICCQGPTDYLIAWWVSVSIEGIPRSPCVGMDGYFYIGDMTSLSLLWKQCSFRRHRCPVRRTWEACVQLLCHRETEWGSVQSRHGKTSISSTWWVCNCPINPTI